MNENIDLTKILKDCPKGFNLYSPIFGDVYFQSITFSMIHVVTSQNVSVIYRLDGKHLNEYEYENTECTLFPSKKQRDWPKFTAPWYKKEKFDPKTLKPFYKIIARVEGGIWFCELLSFIEEGRNLIKGFVSYYNYCIPYNDETKHLVGTTKEAPEYYRYWEE